MAARINSKPATVSKPSAQPNKAQKIKLFARRVVIALLIAAVLSLLGRQVRSVFCGASGSAQITAAHAAEAATDATAQQVERILEFEVCNGFTNQRIALLTGLVIAAELQRSVVLPRFLPDGLQNSSTAVSLHETPNVPFKKWFLVAPLEQVLADHGVRITSQVTKQPTLISCKHSSSTNNKLIELLQQHASDPHIRIDCPAFRIPRVALEKHEQLFQAAAKALHPTKRYSTLIRERQDHIRALTGSSSYNLLHLRIEQDWFALCKRWTNPAAGRNNCMNNTFNVGDQLLEYGFEQEVPIVVITSFRHVAPKDLRKALVSLELQQYTVVLGKDLVGKELQRDESALVDYYLGRGVDQFIGNSVSTFTAMLMMERQWLKRESYSYNGGSIPLAKFIPFDPTKQSS